MGCSLTIIAFGCDYLLPRGSRSAVEKKKQENVLGENKVGDVLSKPLLYKSVGKKFSKLQHLRWTGPLNEQIISLSRDE